MRRMIRKSGDVDVVLVDAFVGADDPASLHVVQLDIVGIATAIR